MNTPTIRAALRELAGFGPGAIDALLGTAQEFGEASLRSANGHVYQVEADDDEQSWRLWDDNAEVHDYHDARSNVELEARRTALATHISDLTRELCDMLAADPPPDLDDWSDMCGRAGAALMAVRHYFDLLLDLKTVLDSTSDLSYRQAGDLLVRLRAAGEGDQVARLAIEEARRRPG